jgi:L-lactate dehydrogenase
MKTRKIVIIGAGHVGSHCASALTTQGLCDDLVLIDIDEKKAIGQALDLSDASVYLPHHFTVRAGGYDECKDADVVVISVGTPPVVNRSRMDFLKETVEMIKTVAKPLVDSGFDGILINISNPADVITHYALHLTGFDSKKVISTSTMLDSSRLRRILAQQIGIDQKSVHAYAMGEHGDSQMVPWSNVAIAGKPLFDLMKEKPDTYGRLDLDDIANCAKQSAFRVIEGKGSTEFGIGAALAELVRVIFHNEKKILPVSVLLNGQYGQKEVYASVPAVVGMDGIEEVIEIKLTEDEQKKFQVSCDAMKKNFEIAKNI